MNKLTLIALFGLLCIAAADVAGCETYEPADAEADPPVVANTICTTCKAGYYKTSDTVCTECSKDNCAICASTSAAVCDTCASGYGVNSDDGCTKCTDTNCAVCEISGDTQECTACKAGFNTDNTDGSEADGGACTACSKGCATCGGFVDGNCVTCPSGSEKNSTNKDDVFCCPQNCSTCSNANTCLTCKAGSSLDDKNACVFGFKTGASLTLGAVVSLAILSLLF